MLAAQRVDAAAREGAQKGELVEGDGQQPFHVEAVRVLLLQRAQQRLERDNASQLENDEEQHVSHPSHCSLPTHLSQDPRFSCVHGLQQPLLIEAFQVRVMMEDGLMGDDAISWTT